MLTYCTRILKFLPASFITVILKREVFMDKDTFKQEAKTLLSEAEAVIDLDDSHQLDQTAATLEGYHYAPTLLWPINGFVRMNKEKLLRVMKEAFESDDDALISYGFDTSADLDEKRLLQMRSLLHHYRFLLRLRKGEAEAWDQFSELYEDD